MLIRSRPGQRGLSLVEMMVGIAVGLFIVAAATLTVSNQLAENRRLLLETQVQQDLRAAADIITRELRRAGAWDGALGGMWTPAAGAGKNLQTDLSTATGQVDYRYRRGSGTDIQYSFKLENNTLKSVVVGSTGYQELTDPRVLKVTAFSVTPQDVAVEVGGAPQLPCPKLCANGTQDCWPTLTVRALVVDISAEAANDASVRRSIRSTVRLRNDVVGFNDAGNPNDMCPP